MKSTATAMARLSDTFEPPNTAGIAPVPAQAPADVVAASQEPKRTLPEIYRERALAKAQKYLAAGRITEQDIISEGAAAGLVKPLILERLEIEDAEAAKPPDSPMIAAIGRNEPGL